MHIHINGNYSRSFKNRTRKIEKAKMHDDDRHESGWRLSGLIGEEAALLETEQGSSDLHRYFLSHLSQSSPPTYVRPSLHRLLRVVLRPVSRPRVISNRYTHTTSGLFEEGHHALRHLQLLAGGPEAAELMDELRTSGELSIADRAKIRLLVGDREHLARVLAAPPSNATFA